MRLLLLALISLPLAACNAVIPIDLAREVTVTSPGGAFSVPKDVDLTGEQAWSERGHVKSVSISQVETTIVAVGQGNLAQFADLALFYRADGAPADGSADVHVATLNHMGIAQDNTAVASDTGALGEAITGALAGSGHFTVVLEGDVDEALDATVRVRIIGDVRVGQ
jgi:hypothetical protein